MIALPRFPRGSLEVVKWLALGLMVLDHVDAFLFHRQLLWACALGRLVFPLFALVLGYNLSRPDALASGVYGRVLSRLAVFGVLAQLPHGFLTHAAWGLWPLNVLATFAVAVGCMWLLDRQQRLAAVVLFLVGGVLVEYFWPGVAVCLGAWMLYRRPGLVGAYVLALGFAGLFVVNGSWLACWALPVLLLAARLRWPVPRLRWAFYGAYPLHLAAFVLVVWAM